jgi:transglutaminase-like putative cysteine protease
MKFETYFQIFSYAMLAVATLALLLAGGLSLSLAVVFWAGMFLAWKLEKTKWQLSERTVLIVVLLSLPLFLLDWKYQQNGGETVGKVGVSALAHLIVFLSAVKLLQDKKDRDWVFLYLISFFEVLLAAGLSFSPIFLGTLTLYLLCSVSTIIAFEIQKSKRSLTPTETHLLVPPDSRIFKRARVRDGKRSAEARRLPLVAMMLLLLTFVLAVPLFLVAPRSGAAALTRSGGSLSSFVGFSENVTLGELGDLKRDSSVVMHVRLEDVQSGDGFRWRGVALDEFTGRGWRKSPAARRNTEKKSDKGFFQLGTTEALHRLTTQTVFLEPIESPALFATARPVAIQGDFPVVLVDGEGSMQTRRHEFGRMIYKVLSDVTEPDAAVLRNDSRPYPAAFERYLQLPAALDSRIDALANAIVVNAKARNRYDEAKALEAHLQREFGYSLEMKAGGPDPLADFLFRVKAGHCEYFSTALAVMLRTRGIAARVVNGFLPGEYNDAAAAYTVRQSDAHSWVEVYFAESQTWVTFDATPSAGRTEPVSTGLAAQVGKYAEALELIWFQYVVGYDKQEQRSLATSVSARVNQFRFSVEQLFTAIRQATALHRRALILVSLSVVVALLFLLVAMRVRRFGWRWAMTFRKPAARAETSAVEFYQRLLALLASRGLQRNPDLTPLEFAGSIGLQPALAITRAYNRVRFGGQELSLAEAREIEKTLKDLERENA